jgi:hypothetical protein
MYKYEQKINERIANYNWKELIDQFRDEDGTVSQDWIDVVFRDFRAPLDANARYGLEMHYYYNEKGVFKREATYYCPSDEINIKEIECAKTDSLPTSAGLYFIGMIGQNPDGENYYLIKIGTAENIKKRLQAYATYNPMIYIGGCYCVKNGRVGCEERCHRFLSRMAYAQAQNSKEWFYVSEEDYYALCNLFMDKDAFAVIAEGEVEW